MASAAASPSAAALAEAETSARVALAAAAAACVRAAATVADLDFVRLLTRPRRAALARALGDVAAARAPLRAAADTAAGLLETGGGGRGARARAAAQIKLAPVYREPADYARALAGARFPMRAPLPPSLVAASIAAAAAAGEGGRERPRGPRYARRRACGAAACVGARGRG